MRNFTLGKKGISMLFLTFILLIGSLPSYGQECPTVTASDQAFCDAQEPTIGDLEASITTGDLAWYSTQTGGTALPDTQILQNNTTYFAGNADGDCPNRVPVNVTIFSSPEILGVNPSQTAQEPVAQMRQSLAVIGICVDDINNPGVTVSELRTNYDNVDGVVVNWYTSRTSNTPLDPGTELQNNTDYFAGLTVSGDNISGDSCETNRTRTTVRFYSEDAPEGEANQTFCEIDNPTLGDISATGENRYYTTATSITELSSNTPLVNERTYYISTVGEFCESTDRLAVTVTIADESQVFAPVSTEICSDDITNPTVGGFDDFFRSLAANSGIDAGGTFSPTIEQLHADYQNDPFSTFSTTYSVETECGIDTVAISVTVIESEDANAGMIEDMTVPCGDTEVIVLDNDILSDDATAGGMFTADEGVLNADGNFDPAIGPGEYVITYTVDESIDCVTGTDSTSFTITVQDAPFAGNDQDITLCDSEVEALMANLPEAANFLENIVANQPGDVDTSGSFAPGLDAFMAYYNAGDFSQPFATTYTVGEDECIDEALITITIIEEQTANAGTIDDISVPCGSTEVIVLDNSILSEDATPGGTFTAAEGVLDANGNFDPAIGPGVYEITYTVSEDDMECVEGTDSYTFNITFEGVDAEDIAIELCSDRINNPTPAGFRDFYLNLIEVNTDLPLDGTFDPTMNTLVEQYNANPFGVFATNYTANTECGEVTIEVAVEVIETQEANAGEIANIEDVCPSADVIVLDNSLLSEDATPGGMFTANEGILNEDGNFDPSIGAGEYTITYTVDDSMNCITGTNSTSFTITVVEGPNAGPDVTMEYCITEIEDMTPEQALAIFTSLVGEDVDQDGTFSPDLNTLFAEFIAANRIGMFSTTYTVTEGDCEDSAELTLIVNDTVPADAGDIDDFDACQSTTPLNLFTELGVSMGTFSTEDGVIEDGMLDVSTMTSMNITYTVSEENGDCVIGEDSTSFTVTVVEGVDAGDDQFVAICDTEIPPAGGVRDLFLGLLDEGVSRDGTFSPTIEELITRYNTVGRYGDFTTTYTVSQGGCEDSTELTVRVLRPIGAGQDRDITFCATEGPVSLYDYLGTNAATTGTFEGYEDGMFDPSTATPGETFTINYMVELDDTTCSNNISAVWTITVTDPVAADAGSDVAVTYCADQNEDISLFDLLDEGVNTSGSFSAPYQNGMFNPSVAGEGDYVITYTLEEGDACVIGTDSATITITVAGTTAEAPVADAEQFFCLVDNPTVADLQATGTNVVWYTDAELTTPANPGTVLVNNAVYYAVNEAGETACEISDAVMVTVTVADSLSPTIQPLGNEFCRGDNPTVADLIANLDGDGIQIYTAATGGSPLAATTALQNNTTYYATATDPAANCESSERLPINVSVEFCGIPEGFSPNGDNVNDTFEIPNIRRDYPNFTIEIFNRWGNVVFKGNASVPDWDGVSNQSSTLGDNVLPAGVYFYILNYNDGQTEPHQGKVYLSR